MSERWMSTYKKEKEKKNKAGKWNLGDGGLPQRGDRRRRIKRVNERN